MRVSTHLPIPVDDIGDLIDYGEDRKRSVEPRLLNPDGEKTQEYECCGTNRIGQPKPDEVVAAFDESVDNVGNKQQSHEREDPFMPRVVIAFESVVFADLFRKEECAQKVKQNRIKRYEEIDGEGPFTNSDKVELPPPEMDQVKKEKQNPDEMHPVNPVPLGMLNDESNSFEQMGHAQAHDHPEKHSYVKVEIHVRFQVGGTSANFIAGRLKTKSPRRPIHFDEFSIRGSQ
jgi:hypothetical protein